VVEVAAAEAVVEEVAEPHALTLRYLFPLSNSDFGSGDFPATGHNR
jgi:hypothetical protein